MVKFSRFFFLWISTTALTWAFYSAGEIRFVQILLASAFFWTIGIFNHREKISALGAILFTAIAFIGLYRELPFGWMLSGALFAYLAYDLDKFALRLSFASRGREKNIVLITRIHLTRVALMIFLGLLISSIALSWKKQFDLAWGIFVGIIFLWGLGLIIYTKTSIFSKNRGS